MSGNDDARGGARPSAFEAGQKVGGGRFTLIRELGRGGMGVVWLAHDDRLNEDAALKFLPPEVAADAVALDDLRRETQKSRRLTHPNIIRIHDLSETPGEIPFISMEFVDGSNLTNLRLEQPQRCFPWAFLRPLVYQLCQALEYAHGEKVIHRDLKPANLMLDAKDRLKLADFGIAATMSDSVSRISLRHATSGTLAYMSPEQMEGQKPRPTDDIYALGATLYELLSSRPPFYTGNITDQVKNAAPPLMAERLAEFELTNEIPDAVNATAMACLAKEGQQRPQSALAVLEQLENIGPAAPAEDIPETPASTPAAAHEGGRTPASAPGRRRLGLILAGAALVLIISGSAIWLKHPGSSHHETASKARMDSPWTNTLGMRFVPVPGTKVLFSIWDTRVKDYAAYAAAIGGVDGSWRNPGFAQEDTHPVVEVSWDDAKAFCNWLTKKERQDGGISLEQSYRLPTDSEWSVAAGLNEPGGGAPADKSLKFEGVYPWGTEWPPPRGAGNYHSSLNVDDFSHTSPVGSFQPNRFGLFDMGGNVWQWCEDWYDGGRQYRVLRGASWFSSTAEFLSSSFRHFDPGTPNDNYGFRVVLAADSSVTTPPGSLPATNMFTKESAPLQSTPLKPARPQPERPRTNTLDMRFVPVPGTRVLFCVWLTRVRDFSAFISATGYDAGPGWKVPGFSQSPTHPVCDVSWIDAVKFCQWLTTTERRLKLLGPNDEYRLPTDEEWTAAADDTHYPWGDHWPPPKGAGNYDQKVQVDDYENTSPVGSFKPNRIGLYDMGGNLWEWCGDWYQKEMNSEQIRNLHPVMKNDGGGQSFRVLRGASWRDGGLRAYLVTACRNHSEPDARHDNQGFRCVLVVGSSLAGDSNTNQSGSLSANQTIKKENIALQTTPTARFRPQASRPWTNTLGMRFVPVPGTKVLFSIWDTRVQDFEAFVNDTGYNATEGMWTLKNDGWKQRGATWKSPGFEQGPTYPVCGVKWEDCRAFCDWLTSKERQAGRLTEWQSYRLPMDLEWSAAVGLGPEQGDTPKERSCKIKDVYPWGNQWPPPEGSGNFGPELQVDTFKRTSPVESFAANQFGLFDMGGNLFQWCEDFYDDTRKHHVQRGSSWFTWTESYILSSYRREGTQPNARDDLYGFRCVLVVGSSP